MGKITATIKNWVKFNPRSDRANYTWFRLQNDFFHDQAVFGLSDSQRCLYLFILCEASKKNCGTISLMPDYIAAVLRKRESEVLKDFQRLFDLGVLTADSRLIDGEETASLPATLRTNETNVTDVRESPPNPLVEIWNRHRGELSEVRGCTGKRKSAAEARWGEKPETEYWSEIVARMAKSDFCQGRKNQPGPHASWRADFDFLIRPDTQHKVLEGKYDNRGDGSGVYVDPKILELRRQAEEEEQQNAAASGG